MQKRIMFLVALVFVALVSFGSAYARGAKPVTNNYTCSATQTVKCVTRFDMDGDGGYDRWVYVYCDGTTETCDRPDVHGTPIGVLPFGFEIGELAVGVNSSDEWTFHLPVLVNGSEVCSIDWDGHGEAYSNCGGLN